MSPDRDSSNDERRCQPDSVINARRQRRLTRHAAAGASSLRASWVGAVRSEETWNSKEPNERFMNDTLLPALPVDGGFGGAPEERVAEVAHLETN